MRQKSLINENNSSIQKLKVNKILREDNCRDTIEGRPTKLQIKSAT